MAEGSQLLISGGSLNSGGGGGGGGGGTGSGGAAGGSGINASRSPNDKNNGGARRRPTKGVSVGSGVGSVAMMSSAGSSGGISSLSKIPKSPVLAKKNLSPRPQSSIKEQVVKLEKLYRDAITATEAYLQKKDQVDEGKLIETHLMALETIASFTRSSSALLSANPSPTFGIKTLTYFLPQQKEDLPPVIDQDKPYQFVVEPESSVFDPNLLRLNLVPDIYTRDFFEEEHLKYAVCSTDKREKFIVVVAISSVFDLHPGLIITKKGHQEFIIPVKKGDVPLDKTIRRVNRFLHNKYKDEQIVLMDDPDNSIAKDIQKIEQNSAQRKDELKIGIIYAKQGQVNPHDMFKNSHESASFQNFLVAMDLDPKQSTEKWNINNYPITVHWFISPYLNADQHRRDVGNAPCIIFFQDEGKPFDASLVQELGMVPQIFVVIQPGFKDMGYRVGFFRSGNLSYFDPPVPVNHIFLPHTLKDFLLTKIYNGNVMFYYNRPMNRGFVMKREEDINLITNKFFSL